jgi:K+-transporting ATPase c subunit
VEKSELQANWINHEPFTVVKPPKMGKKFNDQDQVEKTVESSTPNVSLDSESSDTLENSTDIDFCPEEPPKKKIAKKTKRGRVNCTTDLVATSESILSPDITPKDTPKKKGRKAKPKEKSKAKESTETPEEVEVKKMIANHEKLWKSNMDFTRDNLYNLEVPVKQKLLKYRLLVRKEEMELKRECLESIFSQEPESEEENIGFEILKRQVQSMMNLPFCETEMLEDIIKRI